MGFYGKQFWKQTDELDCTVEEMDAASEGIFFIKYTDINLTGERGIANVTRKSNAFKYTRVVSIYFFLCQKFDEIACGMLSPVCRFLLDDSVTVVNLNVFFYYN